MYVKNTLNALGHVVQMNWPNYNDTADELRDLEGRELGQHDSVTGNWYDRDVRVAGRMFAQLYPNDTYFLHANLQGSDSDISDYSGALNNDWIYYPWGQWTHWGIAADAHFAGFEQGEGPIFGTPTRSYSGDQGRWLTPDLLGGDIANPQSLNRYAYVLNNPTTLTDPSGLNACNEFNTSYEGSGMPFPCNNCPSSGACGTSNNPSGPAPVTIDSNGDPLSVDISQGEAQYNSNFGWQAQGTLYGHSYNQIFSSLDSYFNWRTNLAVDFIAQQKLREGYWNQLGATVSALGAAGANWNNIGTFIKQNPFSAANQLAGGNFDFEGANLFAPSLGCPMGRCDLGVLGTLDFSHNNGTFHLDTADPFNFPGGTLVHFGVDVVLGNLWYTVIPRPWP